MLRRGEKGKMEEMGIIIKCNWGTIQNAINDEYSTKIEKDYKCADCEKGGNMEGKKQKKTITGRNKYLVIQHARWGGEGNNWECNAKMDNESFKNKKQRRKKSYFTKE